jgi:glyoxylase-like metal-dependent hydrolase (beta-lactamase superfamily II)
MNSPLIRSFYDSTTFTVTHVVADAQTQRAAIIDPVLDYDAKTGQTSTLNAGLVAAWIKEEGFTVEWLLETHCHADHLSASAWLQRKLGGRIGIGARITEVQTIFKKLFNAEDMATDGQPFDKLFQDGEHFKIGNLDVEVLSTPGHTPACVSYKVGDDVFIGDTLFMPDYGSARCDFPGGDAATLYRSVQRLLALPAHTRLHLCHDYPPSSRPAVWVSTVGEQAAHNVHAHRGIDEAEFVQIRQARDHALAKPLLLWPSVQVNVRAGHLPPAEANGLSYLKIPLNAL